MLIDTDLADALIVLRREIHGWPELSNHEHETSRRVRARFEANGIEAIATALARAHGGGAEVVIRRGEPVLENDPAMVALIKAAGDDVGGEGTVLDVAPWTAADDFAFYTKVKPCVYFRLGVGNAAKGCVHGLHHPAFRIDEDALPLGAAVLARAAERFLNDPGGG